MARPLHSHINDEELTALAPSGSEGKRQRLSAEELRQAERHIASCGYCSGKVAKYQRLVSRGSDFQLARAASPGVDCPKDRDVDWPEVAAGLWPELKSQQLMTHAALCDRCGPQLRAALSVDDEPTEEEELLLREVKAPARPPVPAQTKPLPGNSAASKPWRPQLHWKALISAFALLVIAGFLVLKAPSSQGPLSGPGLAEFAVKTHKQYARGALPLEVRSNSQQAVNKWLQARLPFALALPASTPAPGEERPFQLEGARTIPVVGKTAAYVAYRMQTGPVTLMVAPASAGVASGGVEAKFKKVSFHYRIIEGYKVVTWSQHGLTYAQVSEEGASTQRSCMTCHSAMRDRDLSQTPSPLTDHRTTAQAVRE